MDPVLSLYSRVVGIVLLLSGVGSIILSLIEKSNSSNESNVYRAGNNTQIPNTKGQDIINSEYDGFMTKPKA